MNYMELGIYWLGVMLGTIVLALILCGVLGLCSTILDKSFRKGQQAQWETDTRTMRSHACWFGEDQSVVWLIENLAGGGDVSSIREQWRQKRKAQSDADPYTYCSKQATNCARCGQHKHTPIRNDDMGGYVCLTCVDKELEKLGKGM